jgi:hypothetical protein
VIARKTQQYGETQDDSLSEPAERNGSSIRRTRL